jgi:rhamnosyl/mannosyltransferase
LVSYKGLRHAVRALKHVDGTLLIVGNGPEGDTLRHEARQQGVLDRIVFQSKLFHREEIIPYYLAATALWFPSNTRAEAFGLVQVEAMAAGCPVINTKLAHSGVPWVSRHDESGLTIPLNDPLALARTARRLLEEPGLRTRLSASAVARAKAEFDHRLMAQRCLSVYETVGRHSPGISRTQTGSRQEQIPIRPLGQRSHGVLRS